MKWHFIKATENDDVRDVFINMDKQQNTQW